MDVMERIRGLIAAHPVVLFMKGTPRYPMCGFSQRAAQALTDCAADFHAINVLEDPEIRAYLPRHANWPTFPQLYINGELIGGCDITVELHQSGALRGMLADVKAA